MTVLVSVVVTSVVVAVVGVANSATQRPSAFSATATRKSLWSRRHRLLRHWSISPYSEAQFKTLKYRPEFPEPFGCLEDSRAFCAEFYRWYNTEHRHSGIAMHRPVYVLYGRATRSVQDHRAQVVTGAYTAHPERCVRHRPVPLASAQGGLHQPPNSSGGAARTDKLNDLAQQLT